MSYWFDTVIDERECGGCGSEIEMTRMEYFKQYGFEPGGRLPGYDPTIPQKRISLDWDSSRTKATYLTYFKIKLDLDKYLPLIYLKYYDPKYDEMTKDFLESTEFEGGQEAMIKYVEEYLATDYMSELMQKNVDLYTEKKGLPKVIGISKVKSSICSRYIDLSE